MYSIYTPYTYLIGWSTKNVWYYGVRYAKKCSPDDLWKSYFTSSKHVKKFRKENGEPDIIQIRKTFSDANSAKSWEEKVLRKINVIKRKDFLNKTNTNRTCSEAMTNGLLKYWSQFTPEERLLKLTKAHHKAKIVAISKRGKKQNHTGSKNWWTQITLEEKLSRIESTRLATIKYQENLTHEEKSSRGKNAVSFVPVVECPHCNKTGKLGNMNRWHFNNCKSIL
jgi:hypothetical protein